MIFNISYRMLIFRLKGISINVNNVQAYAKMRTRCIVKTEIGDDKFEFLEREGTHTDILCKFMLHFGKNLNVSYAT